MTICIIDIQWTLWQMDANIYESSILLSSYVYQSLNHKKIVGWPVSMDAIIPMIELKAIVAWPRGAKQQTASLLEHVLMQ
mgnify:CR=1 FL=1